MRAQGFKPACQNRVAMSRYMCVAGLKKIQGRSASHCGVVLLEGFQLPATMATMATMARVSARARGLGIAMMPISSVPA